MKGGGGRGGRAVKGERGIVVRPMSPVVVGAMVGVEVVICERRLESGALAYGFCGLARV